MEIGVKYQNLALFYHLLAWHVTPSSTPLRSIFFMGSLVTLFCFVAYSATIVSTLANVVIPIQKFGDLISLKYKFTVHEKSGAMKFFLEVRKILQF